MQVEGSKHPSFLSQKSARTSPGSSVYSQSNSPFQTCSHTEGTPSPWRTTVTAQLTGDHLGAEVIMRTRRPSHLGSWHFYCGARRESCTRLPFSTSSAALRAPLPSFPLGLGLLDTDSCGCDVSCFSQCPPCSSTGPSRKQSSARVWQSRSQRAGLPLC